MNLEEFELGMRAVAAPIWDRDRKVVAAITILGPIYRLSMERLRELGDRLKCAGHEISRAIGYSPRTRKNQAGLRAPEWTAYR